MTGVHYHAWPKLFEKVIIPVWQSLMGFSVLLFTSLPPATVVRHVALLLGMLCICESILIELR